jgi:hypothetical protein
MFGYISPDNRGIDLDAPAICFVVGWTPFLIAWVEYNTAFTEFLVQAYFLTIFLFVVYPRKYERRNIKQLWFWKAMLVGAFPLHSVTLAAMWLFDVWDKPKWGSGRTVLGIVVVAVMIEGPLVSKIVNFFRPENETPLKGEDAVEP